MSSQSSSTPMPGALGTMMLPSAVMGSNPFIGNWKSSSGTKYSNHLQFRMAHDTCRLTMSIKFMVVVCISQFSPKLSARWAIFSVPVIPHFHETSARTMSAAFWLMTCATPQWQPLVVSVAAMGMSRALHSSYRVRNP